MTKSYGIIILAAGASSRLGSPKQLLPFSGGTLLQHVVSSAAEILEATVIVVTGANRVDVEKSIKDRGAIVVFNPDWNTGMASSIKAGIEELLKKDRSVDAAILAVCDQPYVNSEVFRSLIAIHEREGKGICASSYGNAVGTPALFSRAYFGSLSSLQGDEGAKKILKSHSDDLAIVPFPGGEVDIDTPDDYEKIGQA
jgi:molybdenum cofactor cytidylyltransferase